MMTNEKKYLIAKYWASVALVVMAGFWVYNMVYQGVKRSYVPGWANLDEEHNLTTYLSAIIFLSIVVPLFALVVTSMKNKKSRWVIWGYLFWTMGFLFLAADEVFRFHDQWLIDWVHSWSFCTIDYLCKGHYFWIWYYFPFVAIGAVVLTEWLAKEHRFILRETWFRLGLIFFLLVFITEIIESWLYPYMGYTQEFIEVLGALAFFMAFSKLVWKKEYDTLLKNNPR